MIGPLLLLAAGAMAPPPPVLVPGEFDRTIDGYAIAPFYQQWVRWVQARKSAALETMLGDPEEIAGENVRYQPIIEYSWNDDYGRYLAGDVHAYCRLDERYRVVAGSCHYHLRQVRNEHRSDEAGDPLAQWARRSFDPEILARRLRAINWVPGAPLYGSQDRVFATLPSPIPTLIEGSTLVRVDSRQCPAMGEALETLDRRRIAWRLDMTDVGRDSRSENVSPHATYAVYKIVIRRPGGDVTLDAAGAALHGLVGPIVQAAHACIDAQAR